MPSFHAHQPDDYYEKRNVYVLAEPLNLRDPMSLTFMP